MIPGGYLGTSHVSVDDDDNGGGANVGLEKTAAILEVVEGSIWHLAAIVWTY